MITIVAPVRIKSGKKAEFEAIVPELIKSSRAEAGNVSYNLYNDIENENAMTFIETWRDRAAIDFHFSTPHFKKAIGLMAGCCESGSKVNLYTDTGL